MSGIVFVFSVIPLSSFHMCTVTADPLVVLTIFSLCYYTRAFTRARAFPVSMCRMQLSKRGRKLVEKDWNFLKDCSFLAHQFSSVAQSCLTFCDPMDCSTPGFPVHHQLLELGQTHVHQVGDDIQPSHPLSSPFPPPLVFSIIRILSNESALCIRCPECWSFTFSTSQRKRFSCPLLLCHYLLSHSLGGCLRHLPVP